MEPGVEVGIAYHLENGTDVFAGVVFGGMGLMKAGGWRPAAVQAVGREGDRDEREGKRRGGASVAGDDG